MRCSYDEEEVLVFLNNLMGILVPNIPHSVKSVVLAHNLYEFHKPERAHLCHNYKCNYFCSYLKCTTRCTITRRHAEISNTACQWWYPVALCTPPTWKVNSIFILGVIGTNRPHVCLRVRLAWTEPTAVLLAPLRSLAPTVTSTTRHSHPLAQLRFCQMSGSYGSSGCHTDQPQDSTSESKLMPPPKIPGPITPPIFQ